MLIESRMNVMPAEKRSLVVFVLDERFYALLLESVKRVVPVTDTTPLPKAPSIVLGIINVAGKVIPVVDVRKRFGLPQTEVRLSDHFIVAATDRRDVAFAVDSVSGVIERGTEEIIASESILQGVEYIEGVLKLADGMVLIYDLGKFLSLDEEKALEEAMTHKTITSDRSLNA